MPSRSNTSPCRTSTARRRPGLGRRHDALSSRTCAARSGTTDRATSPTRAIPAPLATIDMPEGWHSHKVRAANGIMIVNHEKLGQGGAAEFGGGLGIYDVSRPSDPKLITKWRTAGRGVHRYDFDGRYAYISPTAEGYVGNIVMILDLADPAKADRGRTLVDSRPVEGGRRALSMGRLGRRRAATIRCAWAIGSMSATGTTGSSFSTFPTCRSRRRSRTPIPARRFRTRRTPACAIPQPLKGRDIMVVADEDVAKLRPSAPCLHLDLRHHGRDACRCRSRRSRCPGSTRDGSPQPAMSGCHQPSERFHGTVIPFAWFAQGLRLVDIADPVRAQGGRPFSAGSADGADRASSNDVTIDDRGLIYLVDRIRGVDIIETSAFG